MVNYVSIKGAGRETTILEADSTDRVLVLNNIRGVFVDSLALKGGSGRFGGAVSIRHSQSVFRHVDIENNNAKRGGAVFSFEANPVFEDVTFESNVATEGRGGAVYSIGSNMVFKSSTLKDNYVIPFDYEGQEFGYGGGIYGFNSQMVFDSLVVTNNTLSGPTSQGGGVYLINSEGFESTSVIKDMIIQGNSAAYGGGIALKRVSPIIERVFIVGNSAIYNGGGIYCYESHPIIRNVTIADNWTYFNNSFGAGIFIDGIQSPFFPGVRMVNSIVWGNERGAGSGQEGIPDQIVVSGQGRTLEVAYSDIEDLEGDGMLEMGTDINIVLDASNIDEDPVFFDTESMDYSLSQGSPAIDAGTAYYISQIDETVLVNIPEDEHLGNAPDIGALESPYEGTGGSTELVVEYMEGWNIVGLPLYVEDASYGTLFSDAVTGTLYGYDNSYYGSDVLEAGNGYWLVFTNDGSADISGEAITNLTISLSEGWNLITGISSPVPVGSISDPGGIIVSGTIYGYGVSYYNADAIEPGKGYWINASADGEVMFDEGLARSRPVFEDMTAGANRLTINGQNLYFGIDIPANKMMNYSLPPKPPSGAFDVRFKGNTKIRGENSEIEVMSPYETITIRYDVVLDAGEYMDWVLGTGSGEEYILEQDGEITVPTEDTFTLERKAIIPISYALHQNYPNPFNPVTTLRYDLPIYNYVTLTIYDLNGRVVNQIVNTIQLAGHHSVQWNATDMHGKPVSAGVYLYQIRAGDFVQTKKMVLLK
jgi:predicted outer membrane repeat protein